MGGTRLSIIFLGAVFFTSCITLPRSFHALRYQDQKVYIDKNHYYKVGPLSKDWTRFNGKEPGIVFKQKQTGATLATEAICGAAFEDLSLTVLTNHLLVGLEDVQKIKEEIWTLSQRKALYTNVLAKLDGVSVMLNVVVIKKNNCQFDFLNVVPLGQEEQITQDFLTFVKGFEYR